MLTAVGEYGTALQAASYAENLDVVKLLLEKGADLNAQGTSFVTPRIFLADTSTAGGKYGTPLHIAQDLQNLEIIALFVEHGADPNVQGVSFAIPRISS
jgi:ankyrin repeat protein